VVSLFFFDLLSSSLVCPSMCCCCICYPRFPMIPLISALYLLHFKNRYFSSFILLSQLLLSFSIPSTSLELSSLLGNLLFFANSLHFETENRSFSMQISTKRFNESALSEVKGFIMSASSENIFSIY